MLLPFFFRYLSSSTPKKKKKVRFYSSSLFYQTVQNREYRTDVDFTTLNCNNTGIVIVFFLSYTSGSQSDAGPALSLNPLHILIDLYEIKEQNTWMQAAVKCTSSADGDEAEES